MTVAQNLKDFPPDGKDIQTLICAYICGTKAAREAHIAKKDTIDKDMFATAWKKTKDQTTPILARARASMPGGTGLPGGMGC
jgi:hypothetical protein